MIWPSIDMKDTYIVTPPPLDWRRPRQRVLSTWSWQTGATMLYVFFILLTYMSTLIDAHVARDSERIADESGTTERELTGQCISTRSTKVDFSMSARGVPLSGGLYVENEWAEFGIKLMASGGYGLRPRLFDTSDVGDDPNLGSPNMLCNPPGPGVGYGGRPGAVGMNCKFLGNVLIVQQEGPGDARPSDNVNGGKLTFEFFDSMEFVYELGMLDITYYTSITILYDTGFGQQIKLISVPTMSENSAQIVQINLPNVKQLTVNFSRSGGISFISFCRIGELLLPQPPAAPSTRSPITITASPSEAPSASPTELKSEGVGCSLIKLDFATTATGMPLSGGDYVSDAWANFGLTLSSIGGFGNRPRIFNTSDVGNGLYGDPDLGSPNIRCKDNPGPGLGKGGEPDSDDGTPNPYANCDPLGNVLIIQENNPDLTIPDDNVDGGVMIFKFDHRPFVKEIWLLDINRPASLSVIFDTGAGIQLKTIIIPTLDDNSSQRVPINTEGVRQLRLKTETSGAVAFLSFCSSPGQAQPRPLPYSTPAPTSFSTPLPTPWPVSPPSVPPTIPPPTQIPTPWPIMSVLTPIAPSLGPTQYPTSLPTPTAAPSQFPTPQLTAAPTQPPTPFPTPWPTPFPTTFSTPPATTQPIPATISNFQITMELVNVSPGTQQYIIKAKETFEKIVLNDLPDIPRQAISQFNTEYTCNGQFPDGIDDLYVCGQEVPIDGPGRILGRAGPTYLRRGSFLPLAGIMMLDQDDAASLGSRLEDVVLHELGHVIGLGNLWNLTGAVVDNVYRGASGLKVWRDEWGCDGTPPVDNGVHFRSDCFGNELMTEIFNPSLGRSPFSKLSIASLEDIGLQVDYSWADPFTPPPSCCNPGGRVRQLHQQAEPAVPISTAGLEAAVAYGRRHLALADREVHTMTRTKNDRRAIFVANKYVAIIYMEDDKIYAIPVTAP